MNQKKLMGYVQLAFALFYIAIALLLLLMPAFIEKINSTPKRVGLAVILLLYAGYRGFYVYRKYFSSNNENQE